MENLREMILGKILENLFFWKKVANRAFRNEVIAQSGLFENEIGPGILQSSVQQMQGLQAHQSHKPRATDYLSILSLLCEIFADCMFVEHWTGALKVKHRFWNTW